MHVAVCDDNRVFLESFEKQIRDIPLVDAVFPFCDCQAFLFSIDAGRRYDAVLLDIDWDGQRSGLDVAEELFKLSPATRVIYVTGHGESYAQRIFLHRANLSGFLTKPVDSGLLYANLKKIADTAMSVEGPALILKQRGAAVSIPTRDIFYIESLGHTIVTHTAHERVASYEKLKTVLKALPVGFYQCHKSYIVNMSQIRRFQSGTVLLKNGEQIPISRARFSQVKEAYFSYMGQLF